ncbi:MAG: peptidoglycan recognition family protein [Anaerovoracaceae bacterium]
MRVNRDKKIYKKVRRKTAYRRFAFFCVFIIIAVIVAGQFHQKTITQEDIPSWVNKQLIVSNTTPEDKNIGRVKDIVIHYVANPGSTAMNNRDYFAKEDVHVNAHFVVGLNGEVVQCMPLYLKSAASNNRNPDTISIEVCHPDSTGEFTDVTTNSLVKLTAWLCDEFNISRNNIIRHGDITGKNCPKYFMEHEDKWLDFKEQVKKY